MRSQKTFRRKASVEYFTREMTELVKNKEWRKGWGLCTFLLRYVCSIEKLRREWWNMTFEWRRRVYIRIWALQFIYIIILHKESLSQCQRYNYLIFKTHNLQVSRLIVTRRFFFFCRLLQKFRLERILYQGRKYYVHFYRTEKNLEQECQFLWISSIGYPFTFLERNIYKVSELRSKTLHFDGKDIYLFETKQFP